MDRMLVAVFDNLSKAEQGLAALVQLDLDGSITVFTHAVVVRNPDGTTIVEEGRAPWPSGTLVGTPLGALIGLLGGAPGVGIGAIVGFFVGGTADSNRARIGEDFADDVATALSTNRAAVVAEIEEDTTGPVDTRMEAIGGTVFRRTLSDVRHTIHEDHIAAIKADLAQLKAEHARAHTERKVKLQEKINQLESRLQAQLQKAKERREADERTERAKVELLQAKAAAAKAKAADTHIEPQQHS
ncbi:MAG: DUF1269 domain-containing protein [Terriglobia bacterium]|jgi:uncharacterized membrane protein